MFHMYVCMYSCMYAEKHDLLFMFFLSHYAETNNNFSAKRIVPKSPKQQNIILCYIFLKIIPARRETFTTKRNNGVNVFSLYLFHETILGYLMF